ncbi:FAD dependent oxidoreductase [Caldisphaera lagunensis DSM 15908]|uniref:FAD dependent oxidoreductase n=1 Tax=Caldisphaera lagunensis (strain DSM 15908 / JCM 11604 / ANMR 0165 / IC-154) TaxID=1056495 RepID=L0A9F5_CALLD|nr:FAD-binding oxidoreductase [Caldisphaera lagunensis]AFZ70528.1 FAD dependent oxidoreductase [Caldisphaera lagunensis DSM 15908]
MTKVKIIGAGFSGLWTAYLMAKKGYDVVLKETNYPGFGASSKAAGILSFQVPKNMIDISLKSMELYKSLGDDILYWHDSIWLPKDDEFNCALDILNYLSKNDIKTKVIYDDMFDGIYIKKGLIISQPTINIGKALNVLMKNFEIFNGKINDDNEGYYDIIIYANGPWIQDTLNLKGLVKYKCQAHSVEGKQINSIIEDDINEFYYVPESSKRAIIGNGKRIMLSKPEDGFIVDSSEVYNILEKISNEYKEALNMYPVNSWSAPCITTCDGYPVVGEIGKNQYVLSGLNGAGLTLSAGLSDLLINIIEGKVKQPKYLDPLRFKGNCSKILEIFDNICVNEK